MAEQQTYLMAIDMLCCHLGLSKEEAKEQLGIDAQTTVESQIADTQEALMGLYR
ncbi:heat-shock protein HtpX [Aliivibrio finisterrensis]|uniref:Heat-shock protein HtpX n=1 Tax=Aliivibrio finisterrensis TaxID=511998 RepID=A0A4Q5KMP6_9GAMM|nr:MULTISPECIES: heat-shock protein HtpX [Aliivibrio]MDD9173671.1 heat-shock protein HtpX [Aliivibrio sp. S3TY1]MDD9190747.1 heat-shock protein HtpX [Aliivibrio sp. S2TY2]RYU46979.1 heat-shock protein HtpX [Aliivibrio finisterrensis]RYU67570.1 heat-shock protein HtpX [Aliivibrio finisterrensis]RYU71003.1 heat-shock protein HtpX [Aliivibrio finisterrensis]